MRKKYYLSMLATFVTVVLLVGCVGALQRGLIGNAYVSTARPAIMLQAKNMPLLTGGQGSCNLVWSDMLGGLPINVWLAVYGQGGLSPMAIVAQAQTPQGWHWDGIMRRPFSVDEGVEIFNGVAYQACTFVINPANDPFGGLVTANLPDGQPQQWIVRAYAARYNFDMDKIIMEYREPLPADIVSLTAMPLGYSNFLNEFAQRARDAFVVSNAPTNSQGVTDPYAQGISWVYMGQQFLGSASQDDILCRP